MPRYIDADALYRETEKRIKEANAYRMAVVDGEFLDLINDAFTEDVAPRREVAREIFDEIEQLRLGFLAEKITRTDLIVKLFLLKKKYTEDRT